MTTCTILVKDDKSLILSGSTVIRQGSETDTIQILVPLMLDNISLSYASCTVTMRYINNAENRNHAIVAQPDIEIYKNNYIRYTIPTESLFTGSDGFTNISGLNKIDIVIKVNDYPTEGDLTKITTGEGEIEIIPSVFPLNTSEQGGGGGTSDYNDLANKPKINGHTLTGNQSASDLGITENTQADWNEDDPSNPSYINNKPAPIQLTHMPLACLQQLGKIYQYIGPDVLDGVTHGYFYECMENDGTYEWVQTNVQPEISYINYTTEEHVIGTFIGSPLFEKTFIIELTGATSYTPIGARVDFAFIEQTTIMLDGISGDLQSAGECHICLDNYDDVSKQNSICTMVRSSTLEGAPCYVTIRYVKHAGR